MATHLSNLQNKFADLHDCKGGNGGLDTKVAADKANNIVCDIGHLCLQDITDKEIDYSCSLLFDKENGLLTFLRQVALNDEFTNCKASSLEFLLSFMNKVEKKVLPYAVDLKDVCISLFRDRFAKVKNGTFPVLIKLLELTTGSKMGDELKVSKIVEKYFMELTQATKHSATVKQGIYTLLGVICKVYPELMVNYSERLLGVYMKSLKEQMTSQTKKPELSIIAGCFDGLTSYLVNFTQSAEEGSKYSYDIFNYTRKAINPNINMTRYQMVISALSLLKEHGQQFGQYLIEDYQLMYERLSHWGNHHNRDVAIAGRLALETFLKQIADMLVYKAKKGTEDRQIFQYFIQKFCGVMNNNSSDAKQVSLAIRGYGYFAAPCKIFMTPEDVKFMFSEMIQRSEQLFFTQTEVIDEKVHSLPSFVEALASIIKEVDEVSDTFLGSMERLVVILIENFHKFHQNTNFICIKSILRVLMALAPKGATFRNFLSKIVYQGLIRTCSHPVVVEIELQESAGLVDDETRERKITYKDYIPLWESLLDVERQKYLLQMGMSADERKALRRALYDEIVSSVLRILEKLDLSSAKSEGQEASTSTNGTADVSPTSDPVAGLTAAKPKDFQILINLVDFCRDLLSEKQHYKLFEIWMYTFGHEVILLSTRYPLVSGFYKLLATCMKICNKLVYFQEIESFTKSENAMDTDSADVNEKDTLQAEKDVCFVLFTKFTKEVLVRMKQYKDDLLASCLVFILALPQEIVVNEINLIVPALKTAFKIGLSYLPLALAGLEALDQWSENLPPSVIQPYYKEILPCLDAYLKTTTDQGQDNSSAGTLTIPSSGRSSKSRKIPVKLLKSTQKKTALSKNFDTQLATTKQRIVKLLGAIGGSNNPWLVTTTAADIARLAVAWDTEKHLKFDMPFMDIKPTIYFDPFLPRIVELATTSSDRQAKVAASELLHSMVLYMLGRSAQQPGDRQEKFPMDKLHRRVFPVVLQLACDVEQVSRQLFEPLMMQLIHWFTGNKKFESEDTVALLDAILDGVIHPTDTALRDFSAKCIKEFLRWSIKQTTKKEQEKSPHNAKSLLKRLYSYALHPNAFKRIGAALAFNQIYAVFREEEALVDMFTFEILANYVDSLAIAHQDDKSLGSQEQCMKVLDHLERIIRVKADVFMKESKSRRLPRDWKKATLDIAVRWLMRQCGRPQTECRHACMELVSKLAPCIKGIKSCQHLFQILHKPEGAAYFLIRFEGGGYKLNQKSGLARYQTLTDLEGAFSLKATLHWFDLLLAALDCYTWIFGQDLLLPSEVLSDKGSKVTCIFKSLEFFLTKLALSDIEAAVGQFSVKTERSIFTPKEVDDYNKAKCTVIVRVMDFMLVMLGKHPQDCLTVIPVQTWSKQFWELVCCLVLEPSKVGFNMGDVEVMMKLPDQVMQLLQVFSRRLPQDLLNRFKNELASHIHAPSSGCDLFSLLPITLTDGATDCMRLTQIVSGYEQLQRVGLLQGVLLKKLQTGKSIGMEVMNSVFREMTDEKDGQRVLVTLTPTAKELAQRLLQLAFVVGIQPSDLLALLMESTFVVGTEGRGAARYGSVFYTEFKVPINQFIIETSSDFIASLMKKVPFEPMMVSSILQNVFDQISRDRNLRKNEGVSAASALLKQWELLTPWWKNTKNNELKTAILAIFNKVLLVDSKVTTDIKHESFQEVFTMYCHLLTDSNTNLTFKSQVLNLLFFYTNLPEKQTAELKSSLDRLVADNFPLKSTEFPEGSPQYNEYVAALGKILNALELSGSLMLLELLISIMCREAKHAFEDELQNSLAVFIKRLATDKQKPALDVAYRIFMKEDSYPNDIRQAALARVCLPMLWLVHAAAVREFFMDHIREILGVLEAKQAKPSESGFETQLVTKICCFQLVEVLFSQLPKEEIYSKNSAINQKYCGNNLNAPENALTAAVTKAAHVAKKEDMRGETLHLELRRRFHCAAYNALIAVVSCTKDTKEESKFYDGFLFSDNPKKGEFLLDNIIDKDRKYTFERELESPIARKKTFVSIRKDVRESRHDGSEDESYTASSSVHYLASQYLADSSLSDEVSQFDRLSSAQTYTGTFEKDFERRMKSKESDASSEDQESAIVVKGDYVEMDMDELNQHECMATLMALLQHMQRNNITPAVEKGTVPQDMPNWMSYLHRKFSDPNSCTNLRLFIARLIINAQEVFRPYTKFWLSPLVQFIVTENSGTGLNYMLVDIVVTMLSWGTVAIPQDTVGDRAMASSLVEFLMKNCHHETRGILRNNLEMLKTLVECWRDRIDIPVKIIFDHMNKTDPKDSSTTTGIQLLGVVVANKLPPYKETMTVDKERYYHALATNLMKNSKKVHTAAAEVLGMVLKYLSENDPDIQVGYHDLIYKILSTLQQGKPDQFINCVHRIQLHYPPMADRFTTKLLFMLPSLHGEFKTLCLEIILSRIDNIEHIFLELKNKGLLDLLNHRDEATQQVTLKIVHGMLKGLCPKDLLYLLPSVVEFTDNPSHACRATMYEILMWIYDNYREEETEEGHQIMTQTKDTLLKGLSDDEIRNRLTIQNFWSHETRLPTGTLDRMVAMLEAMYSPATENQYLSYATNLLLEMTSKSPDYNREIFEHPLSECKFSDYSVSASWRQRHAGMTPLFVETFASQGATQGSSLDESMAGVRATQDVQQFTQTQQEGASKNPYNWLTQSSLDTFTNISMSLSMADSQQSSSLMFNVGKTPARQRRQKRPLPAGFGKEKLGGGATPAAVEETEQDIELKRLKRRFVKDQTSTSHYFARKNLALKKKREETLKEQRAKREFQVTMYRKYRIGDLPDIQIKYSYIIAPLQALAQRDSTLAKMLFSAIFRGIFLKVDDIKTEREVIETTQQINQCLNDMLSNSSTYYPQFIACIQDIAFHLPKKLKLDASTVNTCCVTSLQQPLGIVLLEEQLLQQVEAVEPPSKRRRGGTAQTSGAAVSQETSTWIELARVYKSLGDYDVLRGIFSGMINTKQITHDALEAEARGDFSTAVKLYNDAISETDWSDGRPQEVEVDLWDDCRLKCFDQLTRWSDLEEFTVTCVDDSDNPKLEKVWEDTYSQEHYLPFIIRSKLKLMVEGDEHQQDLLTFIDQSMKTPERKALLETRFCEELALMYLWQEDYDRARYYASNAIQLFLQDWSSIDTLMLSSRIAKLQGLQKLTELQEFLEFMRYDSNFQNSHLSVSLVDKWLDHKPDPLMDPSNIWDDIVTNRCVFIDHLNKRLESQGIHEETHSAFELKKVLLRLSQAGSAREQNNFPLALKLLKTTHRNAKATNDEALLVQWTHCYSLTHQQKVHMAGTTLPLPEKLKSLLSSMDQLQKLSNSDVFKWDSLLGRQQDILQAKTLDRMALEILENLGSGDTLPDETLDKIATLTGCSNNMDQVVSGLVEKGYSYMRNAVQSALKEEGETSEAMLLDVDGIIAAHMTMVRYCDQYLRKNEEGGSQEVDCPSLKLFPETVITSLLAAMKHNSKEARQKFARLLQIVESFPDTMDTFIEKTKEIPCWMFISWISQMVSYLDKPEAKAVQDILTSISQEYPQALIYPFKISSESFQFGSTAEGKRNKAAVDRLEATLSQVPLVNTLIAALEQFGQPNALFGDWIDDMKKLLEGKSRDKIKVMQCFKGIYAELMDHRGSVSQDTSQSLYDGTGAATQIGMGPYRRRFAQAFAKEVETLFGNDGAKIVNMSLGDFVKKASSLRTKMTNEAAKKLAPPRTLKEYSPWLHEFNAANYEKELEIPGQYDGLSKPMPEYHTKISGFDERVLALSSLRKPKRIIIRGNDEKDHMFLVKGGEDLRQDQRIEQLFVIMNEVFQQDPACRQRKLVLRTYQVIPMTPRVGLIEWMRHTQPLKEFMAGAMTKQESTFAESDKGAKAHHLSWIDKFALKKNDAHAANYPPMYSKASKAETVKAFREREGKVPWDLLRRAFLRMSSSPEAFFTLRSHFISSHALICTAQYILGIGDRHLSNFMIDLETGGMVGIDFGHAFGSATQFLPVPELMPFRLTRQILNLMMPMKEKGMFEFTMVHGLRALRKDYDLLMNVMDVFIKDVSLDWIQNAEKQKKEKQEAEDAEIDNAWYPKQKVAYAKRKLQGANSCHITRDELKLGHSKKSSYKAYVSVCMGDGDNVRHRHPDTGLSVEDQVACLIDQATDPNILGRTWIGWEPWM